MSSNIINKHSPPVRNEYLLSTFPDSLFHLIEPLTHWSRPLLHSLNNNMGQTQSLADTYNAIARSQSFEPEMISVEGFGGRICGKISSMAFRFRRIVLRKDPGRMRGRTAAEGTKKT